MAGETSLLDWILGLLRDPDARAAFQADPTGYAAHHGFEGLSAADVHDALYLIADNGSASYDYRFGTWNEAHYPAPGDYAPNQPAAHYLNDYVSHDYPAANEPWADPATGATAETEPAFGQDPAPGPAPVLDTAPPDTAPPDTAPPDTAPEHARYGDGALSRTPGHADPGTAFGSGDTSPSQETPHTEPHSGHFFTPVGDTDAGFDPVQDYTGSGGYPGEPTDDPGDPDHGTHPHDDSYTDVHHS